jgi:hypothetical protein
MKPLSHQTPKLPAPFSAQPSPDTDPVPRFARTSSLRFARRLSLIAIATGFLAIFFAISAIASPARADEPAPQLKFADGRFEPAVLDVSAGAPLRLTVINTGTSAIEFESFELNRERVVPPGRSITVLLPRLDPGQYHFFDDFHHDAGQGTITAR